jgi:hypothetical protein
MNSPIYLRRKQAAQYVREKWGTPCSPNWLAKLAVTGGGPTFVRAGRIPFYTADWLDVWVKARFGSPMRSTSEVQGGGP